MTSDSVFLLPLDMVMGVWLMNKNKTFLFLLPLLFLAVGCDSDDADERSKFIGRYEVEEVSLETYSPRGDYEVRIRKEAGTEDLVIICNFYNYNLEVLARVTGNAIEVFYQEHNVYAFEGTGHLSGSVITLDYTVSVLRDGENELFDRLRAVMTLKD